MNAEKHNTSNLMQHRGDVVVNDDDVEDNIGDSRSGARHSDESDQDDPHKSDEKPHGTPPPSPQQHKYNLRSGAASASHLNQSLSESFEKPRPNNTPNDQKCQSKLYPTLDETSESLDLSTQRMPMPLGDTKSLARDPIKVKTVCSTTKTVTRDVSYHSETTTICHTVTIDSQKNVPENKQQQQQTQQTDWPTTSDGTAAPTGDKSFTRHPGADDEQNEEVKNNTSLPGDAPTAVPTYRPPYFDLSTPAPTGLAASTGESSSSTRYRPTGGAAQDASRGVRNSFAPQGNVPPAISGQSTGYNNTNWLGIMGAVCLLAVAVWLLCPSSKEDPLNSNANLNEIDSAFRLKEFQSGLIGLQSSFPSQTPQLWKILRVATKPIMESKKPEAPASFIFAAPQDASRAAECLAKKYAELVTRTFKAPKAHVDFDRHILSGNTESPEEIKMDIDDALNSGFISGSRAAIIHHLERLHGVSAMMFHGYCDNENASFKRVAIIFTLHMDTSSSSSTEERDGFVEALLRNRWLDDIDADKFEPLMSRIGNSNVFVRAETDEVLTAMGC